MKTRLLACFLLAASLPAQALHRCEIGGKVEYRDTPCPSGKAQEIHVDPMYPTPEDMAYALRKSEQEKTKARTPRQINEDPALRRAAKSDAKSLQRKTDRCDQLYRSADLAVERANRSGDKAQINRARKQIQDYELECR